MFATCSWLGCSKSRNISARFLTKWHGDIATRGASRTFGEGLGRSTVAHFARKVRGGEYCGGQARAKNPTKICPRALAIFATCSWPSLCKQSELQCWRRNRRLCGPAQISAARALLPLYKPLFSWIFNTLPFQGRWRLFTNLDFYRILNTLIRGPHFASKVSYNVSAATDDYAGQRKPPHFPNLYFSPTPKNKKIRLRTCGGMA